MIRKVVSWALVGVFAYLWWWAGHRWAYLNTPGNEWMTVYVMFTFFSVAILLRGSRATGTGLVDRLVGTVKGFIPVLPWFVLVIVVMRSVAWLHIGMSALPLDHYIHAVVAVLAAGITTALWYGAIANAGDS